MTTSILNDCLELRHDPPEKLREYLQKINVTIFDAIFSNQEPNDAKQAILYILCAYTEDSPLVILRQDHRVEQENICEYLNIPEFKRNKLITLEQQEVRSAVTQYMTQFAGPLFKSLMFMKIQYEDYELDITNRKFKEGKGEEGQPIVYHYDIKDHDKAVAATERLAKKIDQVEREIKSHVSRMAGIQDAIEHKNKKATNKTGGRGVAIENSRQI